MKKFFMKNQVIAVISTFVLLIISAILFQFEQTKDGIILANTFLTTQLIAREALVRLRNFLVMKALVYNDYSNTYQKQGDTIRVKKPPVYVADEFSSTINLQNIAEDSVNITLNHIADVSVSWTSKEKALNLEQFNQQVLDPAMEAIAQKIDEDIHKEFYKDVPYYVGTSGATPDGLDDFANAALALNNRKVPLSNRVAVWDPTAHSKFSILDAIVHAEKSGSTQALREGAIGRIQGMDNYMTQNVQTHIAGDYTAKTDVTITAGAAGATSIQLTSASDSGTQTLKKGDIFTLDGAQYVVTADTAAAVSGVIAAVSIYPALPKAFNALGSANVTFADRTAGGHVANMAFIKNACAFVSRPLEPPMGGAQSYSANFEGISLRVTAGYDLTTKTEILSIDTLYGIKAVYPELAVRILG